MLINEEGRPVLSLKTSEGCVSIKLYSDKAPYTVKSFLEVIGSGLMLNNGFFYRAVNKRNDNGYPVVEVLEGGILPFSNRSGCNFVRHESTQVTDILHKDGVISLGRNKIGTASGVEFFICIGDQPALDFGGERFSDNSGFAAFGEVVEGMEVVRRIHKMKTTDHPGYFGQYYRGQILKEPVKIIDISWRATCGE